jgi:hypothetical protein
MPTVTVKCRYELFDALQAMSRKKLSEKKFSNILIRRHHRDELLEVDLEPML